MDGIDLKGKLAGIPVWVIGLVVGGGVFLVYMLYSKKGSSAGERTAEGVNIDATGYHTAGIAGGTATQTYAATETNKAWLARVAPGLASTLGKSPSEVIAALQKWMSGQVINGTEKGIVDKAIASYQLPPDGISGTSKVVGKATTAYRELNTGEIGQNYDDGTSYAFKNLKEYTAGGSPKYQDTINGSVVTGILRKPNGTYAVTADGKETQIGPGRLAALVQNGVPYL